MDSLRNQKNTLKAAVTTKRKGDASARGSEERGIAGPGKKRGRDFETERVRYISVSAVAQFLLNKELRGLGGYFSSCYIYNATGRTFHGEARRAYRHA
jgi:hypothetical protein